MSTHPAITSELIAELQAAMRPNVLPEERRGRRRSLPEIPFGTVYFGPLRPFAQGKEHYGMVRSMGGVRRKGVRDPMAFGPAVPFAPITSRPNNAKPVLELPAGTLPYKRGKRGEYLAVRSFVLLFWRILVTRRALESELRYVARLDEAYREEAWRLLGNH